MKIQNHIGLNNWKCEKAASVQFKACSHMQDKLFNKRWNSETCIPVWLIARSTMINTILQKQLLTRETQLYFSIQMCQ
jgi:hypothetical protein